MNILRNLRITRVALVDKGANFDPTSGEGAHVMLFKRDIKKETLGQVHGDRPVHIEGPECKCDKCLQKREQEKESSVTKEFLKKLAALFKEEGVEMAAPTHDPDDPNCKCADCMSKSVDKRHTETLAKIADLEKRAKDAEDRAKSAEDLTKAQIAVHQRSEMVTLLKSFRATPLKLEGDDNDIERFLKMQAVDQAGFDRMIAVMKATDAQLAESALYKNVGSSMSGGSLDAWSEIEKLAAEMVIKSGNTGLTKEQAIDKVMELRVDLVTKYRNGQQ